jgi:hypothetical protein
MTTMELLELARDRSIQVAVDGDRLSLEYPEGSLTPELRAEFRQHKPALLVLLTPHRFVTLKGGLIVPAAAQMLALDLEARGLPLAVDASGEFITPTDPRLLPADRAAIREYHRHLAAIVEYAPDDGTM